MDRIFAFMALISKLIKGMVSILAPPGEQIATTGVISTSMSLRTTIDITKKQHAPRHGPELGFLALLQRTQAFEKNTQTQLDNTAPKAFARSWIDRAQSFVLGIAGKTFGFSGVNRLLATGFRA